MISSAQTVANTGRRMKKSTNNSKRRLFQNLEYLRTSWFVTWSAAAHRLDSLSLDALNLLRFLLRIRLPSRASFILDFHLSNERAVLKELQPGNDYVVAGFQAIQHGIVVADDVAQF